MKRSTRSSFSKDRQTNEKNPIPQILSTTNSSKLPPLVKQTSLKNPVKITQRQDDVEERKNNETAQNLLSSVALKKPQVKVATNFTKPPISQAKPVQKVTEQGNSSRIIGSSQSGKSSNSINNNERPQKNSLESSNVQDKVIKTNNKTNIMINTSKNIQQSSQKDILNTKGAVVGNRLSQNIQNKKNLEENKIKKEKYDSYEKEEEKEELIEQIAIPVGQQVTKKRGELKLRTHERIELRKEIKAEKTREKILLEKVNYHIYRKILCFSASSYREVSKMMLVCKRFRAVIMSCYEIWECALRSLPKSVCESFMQSQSYQCHKNDQEGQNELQEKKGIAEIKEFVEIESKKKVIRQMDTFFTEYRKLFAYCSTKENIASKMLDKLQLKVKVIINNKERSEERNVKVGSANFHSRIVLKLQELNQILLLHLDFLTIQIQFYSGYLQKTVVLVQKFSVKRIIDSAVYQKAFAYYSDQNFLICFFHGDQSFLYALFEISAMQLVQLFREKLEQSLIYSQKSLLKVEATKKQLKILSKDLSSFAYDSFSQYFKYQSDFEIMVSVHNTAKEDLYKFIDTRCFPVETSETAASFMFSPGDRIFVENVFSLDNKAGMKENVQDLLLLDLILKDRDRFLVCFSGFVTIKVMKDIAHKNSVDMNMDYSTADEYTAKIIEINQPKCYNFEMIIIQTKREAVLKSMKMKLFPGIISNNLPLLQQSI